MLRFAPEDLDLNLRKLDIGDPVYGLTGDKSWSTSLSVEAAPKLLIIIEGDLLPMVLRGTELYILDFLLVINIFIAFFSDCIL